MAKKVVKKDIKEAKVEDLSKSLYDLQEKLVKTFLSMQEGSEKDVHVVRKIKKEIARVKTQINLKK